jgi:2-iminobutanoate/2-iminopropanoate deaminase
VKPHDKTSIALAADSSVRFDHYPHGTDAMIEHLSQPDMPTSHLPFSPAVRFGDLIFVSGQASVDRNGAIILGTFEEEMRRSLANLLAILTAAGSDLKHVVQTRNYVRDPVDLNTFNRLYREYFKAPYPARTTITHCLNEELRYEIDCVAVVAKAR